MHGYSNIKFFKKGQSFPQSRSRSADTCTQQRTVQPIDDKTSMAFPPYVRSIFNSFSAQTHQ